MKKFLFTLNKLTCAGCAAEIERELRTIDGIAGLTMDFLGRELIVYTNKAELEKDIFGIIEKAVNKIEPEVEVVPASHKGKEYRFRDSIAESFRTRETAVNLAGIILFVIAFLNVLPQFQLYTYLAAYLIIGRQVILGALRKLFSRYLFNENLLMTIATIGALIIGEYAEAIAVLLFYRIGRFFESKIVEYSQHSINEMQKLKPEYSNLIRDGKTTKVLPEQVKKGELIAIKPGERIPLDGIIVEGFSEINNSLLTGESLPQPVVPGNPVSAGSVNLFGNLKVRVENEYEKSTFSLIIDLIRTAKSRKTKTERFITRFAAVYTPVVLFLALMIATLPPFLFSMGHFHTWFYRALIFLVISCPCALVISVPLSFFAGLAVFIRNGILIKGGIFLENIARTKVVILDKTGTLTRGKIELSRLNPVPGISGEELLLWAYHTESHSNHPLAIAVNSEYHRKMSGHGKKDAEQKLQFSYTEIPGKGVKAKGENLSLLAGSIGFLAEEGIEGLPGIPDEISGKSVIGVAKDQRFLGTIEFTDTIREKLPEMINNLRRYGVKRILMLTGDRDEIARKVASSLGIKEYHADLLPQDKTKIIEQIKKEDLGKILFIGDGINDAPAMALSDTGMAMGGIGSSVAIESSDIVLQTDEIEKLTRIFHVSRKTINNARQNIIFALSVKILFLILGALGLITIWGAVFADVGVTILAVMNSLRLLYYRKNF